MNFINCPEYINDQKSISDNFLHWNELENCSILITGGMGLICSHLIDCLIYRNLNHNAKIDITITCRNRKKAETRFSPYLGRKDFHIIENDVCIPYDYNKHFDYVIHGASNAHPIAFSKTPVETMLANFLGSYNLLEYLKKDKPKKFLFISSSEIYGKNDSDVQENLESCYGSIDCMNVRSAYPESKRASETLCVSYYNEYGINCIIVRPGFIYGATMTDESSKADAQFIKKGINHEDIVMKSAGTQLRSYCYLTDAIIALLFILVKGESGSAYNIANKNCNVTIREFAETVAKQAGTDVVFENPDDVEKKGYSLVGNAVLNTDKLESLGFQAIVGLDEGISRVLKILISD